MLEIGIVSKILDEGYAITVQKKNGGYDIILSADDICVWDTVSCYNALTKPETYIVDILSKLHQDMKHLNAKPMTVWERSEDETGR